MAAGAPNSTTCASGAERVDCAPELGLGRERAVGVAREEPAERAGPVGRPAGGAVRAGEGEKRLLLDEVMYAQRDTLRKIAERRVEFEGSA